MTRAVSIYHSLLGNIALVIVLLGSAIMAMTFFGAQRTVETLSRLLLRQTLEGVDVRLQHFFDPIVHGLRLARSWGEAGLLDIDNPAALNRLLMPLMQQSPQISSLLVADARGHEHMLLRTGNTWRNRQTRRDVWSNHTYWLEWTDEQPEPVASWKPLDYDPRDRPWYQGALRQYHQQQSTSPVLIGPDQVSQAYWTKPYTFFTTKEPGITASVRFDPGDGLDHVIGFDVLLSDISRFTMSLRVSKHGKALVLTDEGLVIGLPRDEHSQSAGGRPAALLKQPHELGLTVIVDAMRALTARPEDQHEPLRFLSNGQFWWGDAMSFSLAADQALSIAVVVPESDLLGTLHRTRLWIVLITLGVLAVAIIRAVILARRYSRPIEALVRESERISRGDLEPGVPVVSTVTEVHRLAQAHERMREALRTLLKLEGDLQIARQIQQSTLPGRLPVLSGFEMDAWSEAAEETGGDTYDVIGCQRTLDGGAMLLSSTHVERVVLLLADATGHGIGPALSVTQVRAMFRMAVRAGEDLAALIRHMNAQLCTDLHDGRFITAWLGELDATDGTLTSFSCGQAPLLYYDAVRNTCNILPADTVPLAVFDELEVTIAEPIRMRSGDVFVVLSDGIFEATDSEDRQFDLERVIEVITRHHHASATQILAVLREAVVAFTRGVAAADDRTAIVIKRTG